MIVFFFKQKTAYELRISDWSSDVCSSDLKVFFIGSSNSLVMWLFGPAIRATRRHPRRGSRRRGRRGRRGPGSGRCSARFQAGPRRRGWHGRGSRRPRSIRAPEGAGEGRSEERRVGKEGQNG